MVCGVFEGVRSLRRLAINRPDVCAWFGVQGGEAILQDLQEWVSRGRDSSLILLEGIDGCRESDVSMLAGVGGHYPDW